MALRINDKAPDFEAETTQGRIKFHDWIGDSYAVLFSHPKDFTPVCTTELGSLAKLEPEFKKRNVKIIGLSVDPVADHERWRGDIKEVTGGDVQYPMIGDSDLAVAKLYDMLPAEAGATSQGRTPAQNATVRTVFLVGPDKKIRMSLTYPMSTGRNFDEVLRVLDSIQLTAKHQVATPVNWKPGEDVIIVPTVSDEDARKLATIYGLESTSLVPPRSKLIVDLSEGLLTVDDRSLRVGRSSPSRDEVLARYLTLVYSMRRLEPGAPLTLRVDDLDVLGRALRVGSRTLETDLESLMAHPEQLLGWRSRLLKRRVLIPAAGVMVALLGVGALVLVQGPQSAEAGTNPSVAVPAATATAPVPVDIGSAVVQERNADGTPGPVVVRNGVDAPVSSTSVQKAWPLAVMLRA